MEEYKEPWIRQLNILILFFEEIMVELSICFDNETPFGGS